MIGVIIGEKGTGKTKRILELANKAAKEAKGSLVFIDDDNSYMYDLVTNVRFINSSEYHIHTPKMLYGFLSGIAASDFDLEYIFIDGFISIVHHELKTLEGLFKQLSVFADEHNLNIILSINGDGKNVPAFVDGMVLQTF
ncbi:MAG: hypothetical protein RRZ24_03340 [Clostridia bacterium]